MITIQSLMLVTLGFLLASLIGFVVAPAYRARTIRLATERIRRSLPMTLHEIQADKDRLRADHAVRLHRLEEKVEQSRLSAARQLIAINRRDAKISNLDNDLSALRSEHDEVRNARSVLEQTVADRLPKVEHRLAEARKLLYQRDREIAALTAEAAKTSRALEDAIQMNTQSRVEIERLVTTLETRAAQNRDGLSDPRFDGEVAMRAEIEALRARNREQGALIAKLQRNEQGTASPMAVQGALVPGVLNGAGGGHGGGWLDDAGVGRLRRDLAEAESALRLARDSAAAGQVTLESQLRSYKAKVEDQVSEIARLTAAVTAFEQGVTDDRSISLKDSKIAIKAKLNSLQAQVESQSQIIQKLRADAAAANEKLARQASHFMEEMRRLGAGTLPASAHARRQAPAAVRRSLAERITQAKPELANSVSQPSRPANDMTAPPAARNGDAGSRDRAARSPGLMMALSEQAAAAKPGPAVAVAAETAIDKPAKPGGDTEKPVPPADVAQRPRLLDRITNVGKD